MGAQKKQAKFALIFGLVQESKMTNFLRISEIQILNQLTMNQRFKKSNSPNFKSSLVFLVHAPKGRFSGFDAFLNACKIRPSYRTQN